MKSKFLLIFLFILLYGINVFALDLNIDMNYDYPAKPGQDLTLQFTVQNQEINNLTNLDFELEVEDPFTLISSSNQDIALLPPLGFVVLTYKLDVSGDTNPGIEEIDLRYRQNGGSWKKETFDIKIAPQTINLEINSVKTVPATIKPGEHVDVTINIQNNEKADVRNVNIKLNLANLPFASDISEKSISKIQRESTEDISFKLIALSSATLQIYKIPITLDYYDEFGQHYNKQNEINVNVFAQPEIEVSIENDELIINKESKLTLKVLNKGLGDSKFVSLHISSSKDFLINNKDIYIGKIDSDDYETVDLLIRAEKQGFTLPILLSYTDVNNKENSREIGLSVKVYTIDEAKEIGLIKTSYWWTIIVVVVIVIVLWRFLRFIRRRKRRQ